MDDFWVFLILLFVFLFINYSDNKVLEGWTSVTTGADECARVTVLCSGGADGAVSPSDPNGTLTYINTNGSWVKESGDCVCSANGDSRTPNTDGGCDPVNCEGIWSDNDGAECENTAECPQTDGKKMQTYTVTQDAAYGGSWTTCDRFNGVSEPRDCDFTCPPPVNCEGSWGSYGSCSASCGGGTQSRTYTITTAAAHGGSSCAHSSGHSESRACNSQACPPPTPPPMSAAPPPMSWQPPAPAPAPAPPPASGGPNIGHPCETGHDSVEYVAEKSNGNLINCADIGNLAKNKKAKVCSGANLLWTSSGAEPGDVLACPFACNTTEELIFGLPTACAFAIMDGTWSGR